MDLSLHLRFAAAMLGRQSMAKCRAHSGRVGCQPQTQLSTASSNILRTHTLLKYTVSGSTASVDHLIYGICC